MDNVRIGIIGIGNMGSVHANNIFRGEIRQATLAAVCDIDENKLEWAKANLGDVTRYKDYREMIQSGLIDAVIIATPHYLHPEIAIFAFENKMNVLTEKPAGVYTKKVEEMNKAADKAGTVFCIMYNQRTNPIYKEARNIVSSGRLGEPKHFIWIITNWYRTQAYYDSGTWRATWAGEGGGVLLNQCPHNLDLWQWIFGMPSKVRGFCSYGKYHNIEVDDDVTAYAEYENGSTAVFITSTGDCPGTNRLEITGDRGKIVIEDGKIKFWELAVSEREFCFSSIEGFASPEMSYSEIIPSEIETGHNGILQNYINAILYGEKLLSPGKEGINGLTVSNAIHLSDWTNDWVELPIDGDLYIEKLKEKIASSKKKPDVESKISDVRGSYNSRWDIKW
ncbi:MAG: Gfo/Idh/MocA family protein [Saccharofermentanales bacterium]